MAKLTNVLAKCKKITGMDAEKIGMFHVFNYNGYSIEISQNGTEDWVSLIYVKRQGLEDDIRSDYFAGTFFENITQAFRYIDFATKK